MISEQAIVSALQAALPDAEVSVHDLTGTQDHYEVHVASARFAGKSRIEQHRLVYAALGEALKGPIHALKLTTVVKAP
jgi:stress-induced morphogen